MALTRLLGYGALAALLLAQLWSFGLRRSGTRQWRDDFGGAALDEALWHDGPPFDPVLPPGGGSGGRGGQGGQGQDRLGPPAAVRGGSLHVGGDGLRLRRLLWAPLRLRARIVKPEDVPEEHEHFVQLVPYGGGLGLLPGWTCDIDPGRTLPPKAAEAALERWPGGRSCFWNCSERVVERTVEVAVDAAGMASLSDSAGCTVPEFAFIGSPIAVRIGCRLRPLGAAGERGQSESSFPFPEHSAAAPVPCPSGRSARFDWFEVEAARSVADPRLSPGGGWSSWWSLLERPVAGGLPPQLRQALIGVLQLLR